MAGSATVTLVSDDNGERCVVTQADDEIWIADELWDHAHDPDRTRIPGDMEIDCDVVTFGTAGEGLGRVTYRVVSVQPSSGLHVCRRVRGTTDADR